jgi:Ser/Thr protein kinase RdoA (MazF antagonist)
MLNPVLAAFNISTTAKVQPIGNGLINTTYKVQEGQYAYILQKINTNVFANPQIIANNITAISNYLKQNAPDYVFTTPLLTTEGKTIFIDEENNNYRLFTFIPASHTIDVLQHPAQAYEAASQFGQFTKLLARFNEQQLQPTIANFHNLDLRYNQFTSALTNADSDRKMHCNELIATAQQHATIVKQYKSLTQNSNMRLRVTHHDTKISNVLFNHAEKGICVIDLDTVMPGYFISDVGDMMRTYLSPVSEEEQAFEKINIREDFFEALAEGYLTEMRNELTETERQNFIYAGKFMIYMQAIRFLTDYLNNDVYYGAKYPLQNFVRAGNQFTLLQRFIAKEDALTDILKKYL